MRLLLLLLFLLPSLLFAQIRFKLLIEGGAAFDQENFYTTNAGLAIEKKLDIDKSLETGINSHSFEFYTPKTDAFYQAFIAGNDLDAAWDTISHLKVSFRFLNIPIGANYYFTPKFYAGYKLGFNFFSKSTYIGIDASEVAHPIEGFESFERNFNPKIFKKFYLNHTVSFNYIIMRRFELGLGCMFTPKGQFFRQTPNRLYESFNDEVSKYFAVSGHLKIYFFQIKSRSL